MTDGFEKLKGEAYSRIAHSPEAHTLNNWGFTAKKQPSVFCIAQVHSLVVNNMEYRKFDREKLRWAPQSKLSTILSALPIPENFEYIDEIDEYLLPDDSPEKRKSLEEIRAEFESKIDKLTKQRVELSRHYLERGNAAFVRLKEKQDRNFRNLKLYGSTDILCGITSSNLFVSGYEPGSILISDGNGGASWIKQNLEIKPRNWFTKQVLRLFLDMSPT